ncbi:MAG: 50S ribosomal protein L9 [Actinomycetota bacterium]|jgi:large subunit ribosomal protein L9|nr:50S ribosomal protein L9 [Actinomycetota bacterium]
MRVLLRSDVDGLGRRGDIVDVAGGFARNFLFPQGRAMAATRGVEAQALAMRRSRDLREARDRETAVSQAQALAGAVLRVEARAGAAGRLFGSVSAADVVEAVLTQKGIAINRHHVELPEPIKAVGTFEVPVKLFADVTTVVVLEVVGV